MCFFSSFNFRCCFPLCCFFCCCCCCCVATGDSFHLQCHFVIDFVLNKLMWTTETLIHWMMMVHSGEMQCVFLGGRQSIAIWKTIIWIWDSVRWVLALHSHASIREMAVFACHCMVMVHRIKVNCLKHTIWRIYGNCQSFSCARIITMVFEFHFYLVWLYYLEEFLYMQHFWMVFPRYGHQCWTIIMQHRILYARWCSAWHLDGWHGRFSRSEWIRVCHQTCRWNGPCGGWS